MCERKEEQRHFPTPSLWPRKSPDSSGTWGGRGMISMMGCHLGRYCRQPASCFSALRCIWKPLPLALNRWWRSDMNGTYTRSSVCHDRSLLGFGGVWKGKGKHLKQFLRSPFFFSQSLNSFFLNDFFFFFWHDMTSFLPVFSHLKKNSFCAHSNTF